MVFYPKQAYAPDDNDGIVYDLRQIYAKDLLGETLKMIRMARTTENYSLWYHLLKRDLFTEINQKLKSKEREEIRNQIAETKNVLVKYSQAYLKKSSSGEEHEKIEDTLCKLEMLLKHFMETHKMFGFMDDDEGL